jgi:hypothetical protein
VGLGDLEVDEERGDGLRLHAGAAIGLQREGAGSDVFILQRVGDELLSEFSRLPMGDQPTDDATVATRKICSDNRGHLIHEVVHPDLRFAGRRPQYMLGLAEINKHHAGALFSMAPNVEGRGNETKGRHRPLTGAP